MFPKLLYIFVVIQVSNSEWFEKIRNIHTVNKNVHGSEEVDAVDLLDEDVPIFKFDLDVPWEIQAFGSVSKDCTAELTCTSLNYPPPVDNECVEGYIIIEDSYGSQKIGCGIMDFGLPVRPAKAGRDMYITAVGTSPGTKCTLQCGPSKNPSDYIKLPKTRHSGVFETKQCVCGKLNESVSSSTSQYIIGGKTAAAFRYPYMVSLVTTGTSKGFCGASLINDLYVLTAGHCIRGEDVMEVLLHAHLLDLTPNQVYDPHAPAGAPGSVKQVKGLKLKKKTDADEDRVRVRISSVTMHPLFRQSGGALFYDVALLRLERRLNLVHEEYNRVGTICLAPIGQGFIYPPGTPVTLTGWGRPHEQAGAGNRLLQELTAPTYSTEDCQNSMRSYQYSPFMFCAGFPDGIRDACYGDSGGPGIIKRADNLYEQIAVVSWGEGCAKPGHPGIYANIPEMSEWIRRSTQDAIWCSSKQT